MIVATARLSLRRLVAAIACRATLMMTLSLVGVALMTMRSAAIVTSNLRLRVLLCPGARRRWRGNNRQGFARQRFTNQTFDVF